MNWDDSKMPCMDWCTVKSAPPYVCPVCGEKSMHLYLNRDKNTEHGGVWNWCESCHGYSHASCRIPGWWKNLDIIEQDKLLHSPEYLNEHKEQIDDWVGEVLKKRETDVKI